MCCTQVKDIIKNEQDFSGSEDEEDDDDFMDNDLDLVEVFPLASANEEEENITMGNIIGPALLTSLS